MTATNRLAPRGGTIFWGAVLLLLATAAGITALVGTWSWTAVIWLIVAFGALMVVAGLIGGVARAVTPARASGDRASGDRASSDRTSSTPASTDRLTANSTDAPLT